MDSEETARGERLAAAGPRLLSGATRATRRRCLPRSRRGNGPEPTVWIPGGKLHRPALVPATAAPTQMAISIDRLIKLFRGLQKNVRLLSLAEMTYVRTSCLSLLVLLCFAACSVTEQTPADVGQKFEEGIQGNGHIVPNDKDHSQTGPADNSQ